MFELNKKIDQFRHELISNQSMNEIDVKELISHLRDEIDSLNKKGLSKEESFWIARHRLGDSNALNIEFSKVNKSLVWRNRLLLLLLGYFLFTLIPKLVNLLTIPLYFLGFNWMNFRTPVLSPDYAVPIPLYLLILIMISGIFYIISKQKIIFNDYQNRFLSNINERSKMKHKFMISLLVLYFITTLSSIFLKFIMSNNSPRILGEVLASGAIFSFLWNFFLFIFLIIFMISIFKNNKEKIIT